MNERILTAFTIATYAVAFFILVLDLLVWVPH